MPRLRPRAPTGSAPTPAAGREVARFRKRRHSNHKSPHIPNLFASPSSRRGLRAIICHRACRRAVTAEFVVCPRPPRWRPASLRRRAQPMQPHPRRPRAWPAVFSLRPPAARLEPLERRTLRSRRPPASPTRPVGQPRQRWRCQTSPASPTPASPTTSTARATPSASGQLPQPRHLHARLPLRQRLGHRPAAHADAGWWSAATVSFAPTGKWSTWKDATGGGFEPDPATCGSPPSA
jgi:hypothetical protein